MYLDTSYDCIARGRSVASFYILNIFLTTRQVSHRAIITLNSSIPERIATNDTTILFE